MRRVAGVLIVVVAVLGLVVPTRSAIAAVGGCGRNPDFDGDGRADTAVGIPLEDDDEPADSGAVHVIYGSAAGLSASGDQFLHQDTLGVADEAEESDGFGRAVATGDFNGDGFTDLVAAVPFESVATIEDAGAVHVFYGGSAGLSATGSQFLHQDTSGVTDTAEDNDEFGSAVASGDFDNDGRCDLAVGVAGQLVGGEVLAGAVHIFNGSSTGLTVSGDHVIHQDTSGAADQAEAIDQFGLSLASGDFNADSRDDLAVGVPFEDSGEIDFSGAVHAFYGSAAGLTTSGDFFFDQNTSGMADVAEQPDEFGSALAIGDYDADGRDDLSVGIPGEVVTGVEPVFDQGAIHVVYGSAAGLTASGDQFLHQDSPGMADVAEGGTAGDEFNNGDGFGSALASGDFDADGRDDLGVGVPGEDVEDKPDAGAIHVVYGSAAGLTASGDQFLHQDTSGMADQAEGEFQEICPFICFIVSVGDSFGTAVSSGDFDNDGRDDVAVGIPREDLGEDPFANEGAIHAIYGSSAGLTTSGDQFIHQDTTGMADSAEIGDFFGAALPGSAVLQDSFGF